MKKWLCTIAMLLAESALLAATQSFDNVCVREKRLELAPAAKAAVEDDFTKASDKWQPFVNYENKLLFDYTPDGLRLTNKIGKPTDTAWNVKCVPLAVPAGTTKYKLRIGVRSGQNLLKIPTSAGYPNEIAWLDENDLPISSGSTFHFVSATDFPAFSTILGTVPQRARKAILAIGADSPNVCVGVPVYIRQLGISFLDNSSKDFVQEGTFIAGPYEPSYNAKIECDADIPEGTSVTLQLAPATGDGKLLFIGPEGTPNTFYDVTNKDTKLYHTIAYANNYYVKIHLKGNGSATPSIKSLKIGSAAVSPFESKATSSDVVTAIVTLKSPARQESTTEPLVVSVTDEYPVLWDKLTVKLDGQNVTSLIKRQGDQFSLVPENGKFAEGVHEIEIRVPNTSDGVGLFKRLFYRGPDVVPEACRVSLRDDGMTLVGGKPFFPIGIYAVCKRDFNDNNFDNAFAKLRENGFNTAHTYGATTGPEGEEFFAAAEKYGFKLYVSRGGVKDITKHIMRKSLLSWYIGDDTSMHQRPEGLFENHSNLKNIDPWHLTCQADGIGGIDASHYRPFIHGTDVFMPEIYPVQEDDEETKEKCVAQVIVNMRTFWNDLAVTNESRAKRGQPPVVKSCWSIIQHFQGWGWKRYPTEKELRAMSYGSIAAGAHGITWYTYGGRDHMKNYGITHTPEVWNQITTITRELSRLQEVLCERTVPSPKMTLLSGPEKDAYDSPSITVITKRHDGKTYILAVNSTLKDVKVAFDLASPSSVRDWFTDKPVAPAGTRRIETTFAQHDVKLFVLE